MSDGAQTERLLQESLFWKIYSGAWIALPNYTPRGWFESDLFVVRRSMYAAEYEIKTTVADFRADFNKRRKHQRLQERSETDKGLPRQFYYVVPDDLVSEVPEYAGLLYVAPSRRVKVVKRAPVLGKHKVDDNKLKEMGRTAYFRLWAERRRRDELFIAYQAERRHWRTDLANVS